MMFDDEPLIRIVFDKVYTMGYDTFVITDSPKIADHIPSNNVIMSGEAENGTARIASFLDFLGEYETIINIQGDMIDITRDTVQPLIDRAKQFTHMITLYTDEYEPSGVKVIHQHGKALWFTRAPIGYGSRHIGIYAYRPQLLRSYDLLHDEYPQENLEQNRILGMYDIDVCRTVYDGREINTEQDVNG